MYTGCLQALLVEGAGNTLGTVISNTVLLTLFGKGGNKNAPT